MDLKLPLKNYTQQTSTDTSRVKKLIATTLQYDLNIPTLIRFLGRNYDGEYRDSMATIKAMENNECNNKIIEGLQRLLEKGSTIYMNASSTHKNFLEFSRYGSHSSIDNTTENTLKVMNKEDKSQ